MAEETGLSRGYIADMEYGLKRTLPRQHWGGLVAAGLGITWSALEEMEARSSQVKVDLRNVREGDLPLALQLLRWLRAGKIPQAVRVSLRK